MKGINYILHVVLVLLLFSCDSRLDPKEYVVWVEEHLSSKRVLGGFEFESQYEPSNYRAIKKGEALTDSQQLSHFQLTIGMANGKESLLTQVVSNQASKQELIYYLSFGLQKDIYLEVGERQYPCVNYHYERSHGIGGKTKVSLLFDTPALEQSGRATLVVNPALLKTGPVKLPFDFHELPTLKQAI